jgi:putative Mg2+ transporter-C (MgtC) family protein
LHGELLVRILLGTVLGGVIGFERDLHGRAAGLRTHAIVALASATFMVVSTQFTYWQHYKEADLIRVDTSRIAASVVSGIGFLGAGAILRTGLTIRGLTTAAGLWLVSAIGMAAGGGMYIVATFATLLGLVALTLLRWLEDRGETVDRHRITVRLDEKHTPIASVTDVLGRKWTVMAQETFEGPFDDGSVQFTFEVLAPSKVHSYELARSLEGVNGVKHVRVEKT